MRSPLRVTVITRRHLIAAICIFGCIVGIWQGIVHFDGIFGSEMVMAPQSLSPKEPVRQIPGTDGMALTINVDWGNEVLEDMLALLEEKEVRATFFLTGRWAAAFPEMARAIAEKGHEIGNHGRTHAHPTQLGDAGLTDHIAGNVAILKEATGVDPVPLYAPPYGEQDRRVVDVAHRSGHWTTLWTLDTIDWQNPAPSTIVQRIVPRAAGGAIVLMHPKPQSLAALPTIIDEVRQKGLTWKPLYVMIQEASPKLLPDD